jgi:hypothetical protein
MMDIIANNHSRLIEEWGILDSPRNTSDLGINLNQDFVAD